MKPYKEIEQPIMSVAEPAEAYGTARYSVPQYESHPLPYQPTREEILHWVREAEEEERLGLTMTTKQVHDWINQEMGWN